MLKILQCDVKLSIYDLDKILHAKYKVKILSLLISFMSEKLLFLYEVLFRHHLLDRECTVSVYHENIELINRVTSKFYDWCRIKWRKYRDPGQGKRDSGVDYGIRSHSSKEGT